MQLQLGLQCDVCGVVGLVNGMLKNPSKTFLDPDWILDPVGTLSQPATDNVL